MLSFGYHNLHFCLIVLTDNIPDAHRQHSYQCWIEAWVPGASCLGKCKGQSQVWQPDNQEWNLSRYVPCYIISLYVWIAFWDSRGRSWHPGCVYCLPGFWCTHWLVCSAGLLKLFVVVCLVPPGMMSIDLSGLCMCRQGCRTDFLGWRHLWGWWLSERELQLNTGSEPWRRRLVLSTCPEFSCL